MASNMKAVVFHGKNDLRFEDVPVPDVKDGQVKVKLMRKLLVRVLSAKAFISDSAIMVRNMWNGRVVGIRQFDRSNIC